jgi:hypothetical protein
LRVRTHRRAPAGNPPLPRWHKADAAKRKLDDASQLVASKKTVIKVEPHPSRECGEMGL